MQARTSAYQQALEGNSGLLHGARVLDVGFGSAILSMFAARGGAKHVLGKEQSSPQKPLLIPQEFMIAQILRSPCLREKPS